MPWYEAECTHCNFTQEYYRSIIDRYDTPKCNKCKRRMDKIIVSIPNIKPDLNDFSTENGGKGRYNAQLREYVTSVDDAIKKAKAKGWDVLDKAQDGRGVLDLSLCKRILTNEWIKLYVRRYRR